VPLSSLESERDKASFTAHSPEHATKLAPTRLGWLKRFVDWFWQGRAVAALKAREQLGGPRASELFRRARICAELAARALNPGEPFVNGSAVALARELLRHSVYWSLRAQHSAGTGKEAAHAPDHELGSPEDFTALWRACSPSRLASAAGGDNAARVLEASIARESFAAFAEHSLERQTAETRELKKFAYALLADTYGARAELQKLHKRRLLRVGGAALLLVLSLSGLYLNKVLSERIRDLATNKPWRVSSLYAGCQSPAQDCLESQWFFFHTQAEDSPWVEIDLGRTETFSSVRLINRMDCCHERAHPLVIEVSDDQHTWRQVAKRERQFSNWKVRFEPQSARFVRVRSEKRTMLHLRKVRILP
jgi:hypothetical protein